MCTELPNGLLCAGSFHQVLANIAVWMRAPGCPKKLEPYLRKQEQQNHAIAMKHVQGQVVSKEGSASEGLVAAGKPPKVVRIATTTVDLLYVFCSM